MNDLASDSGTAGGGDYATIDDLIELATIRHIHDAECDSVGWYGRNSKRSVVLGWSCPLLKHAVANDGKTNMI